MLSPIEQAAKTLLYEPLVKAGITALKVQLPALGIPGVSWFVDYIVLKYADIFYDNRMTEANMLAIAIKTKEEEEAYLKARSELLGANDDESKKKAKQDFIDAFKRLSDMRPK